MTTPTQRTLAKLRKEGWTAAVVERRNPGVFKTHDLFGFIDVLAIRGAETLAVQTTSGGNVSARIKKIADSEHVGRVRDAGWMIHVHGWRKKANGRWDCRIEDVS